MLSIFFVILSVLIILACVQYHVGNAVNIGCRRELMIDDYLIDSLSGGALQRLHHPVRQEIALVGDQPWEGNGCGYYTVLQDDNLYRMYYHAGKVKAKDQNDFPALVIAYAESRDGVHWDKPALGLVEFNGSTQNNIVIGTIDGAAAHDFSPFIDAKPDVSADARYKAVGLCKSQATHTLWAFKSPDGVHWQPFLESPVFGGYVFDTQNISFWSVSEGCYVLYYRAVNQGGYRSINRAISSDFITWHDEGPLNFRNRAPSVMQEYYTNQIKTYYRAPHIYIGFPACYHDRGWVSSTEKLPGLAERRDRAQGHARYGSAVTDTLLLVSRDGRNFYTWEESFIKPGLRTQYNWAYGDNYTAWHVVETDSRFDDSPRELSLYASEGYFTSRPSRLRRYTLRLDGFASVFAPISGGELRTKPFQFSGSVLKLNFASSASGSIRVEIQADGVGIAGYRMDDCEVVFGDALDQDVEWKCGSDLRHLAGKTVQLRFELKDADLYAFRFANNCADA